LSGCEAVPQDAKMSAAVAGKNKFRMS
jgi:hypothetical protein